MVVIFSPGLASGLYRVQVGSPLADLAGNIAQAAAWTFRVLGTADSDHDGVPDSVETVLGFSPSNPDTDGDGILDGDEDLDSDSLSTRWELAFNYDPTKTDTDNNAINDGNEDPDGDVLNNVREFLAGTDARNPDSDGDDWNDEAEVTGDGAPLNPLVVPSHGVVARPPIKVTAPAIGVTEGLPFNTVVSQPPVKVIAHAVGSADGLPLNTSVALPPVEVRIE